MIIYRYQHSVDGKGPYSPVSDDWGRDKFTQRLARKHDDHEHPNPWEDFGKKLNHLPTRDYYCSCPDKESLMIWFADDHDELAKYGYEVVEVDVPDEHVVVGRSGRQALFNINHAKFSSNIVPGRLTNLLSMVEYRDTKEIENV